ncbi:MAG: restriction endonuclease [Flavobacteriaceae bacterium]|nr:restriction endonuclease [Flavobacteriaceae bacterium]
MKKENKKEWYNFQEEICEHFKFIGASAETNVRIKGVRSHHDIDILVKTKFLGEDLLWVIEVKKWKEKVSKLHILALRTIVDDIGAYKGFIISENEFLFRIENN